MKSMEMKKGTSKTTAALLAMALGITLAGCGSGTSADGTASPASATTKPASESAAPAATDEPAELTPEKDAKLMVWDGKDGVPFLKEIAKQFTAETGIPVEVQEQGAPEQLEKMRTDGPAGSAADILTLPHNDLGNAVASGYLLPNDFYEEQTKKEFLQPAVDAVTIKGVLYGYPRNMETYALFVNKNLVKDAKLNTWDDVIAFSKTVTDPKKNQYGFMTHLNNFYFAYPFVSSFGGYIFGKNNTDPKDIGLNSPGAVEGITYYQSMRSILPMKAADTNADIKTSLFEGGNLAINLDGVWNIGNFSKLSFPVEMIPLPKTPKGAESNSFAGVKAYYISAYSKYPNAAKVFARYVTSSKALLKNFEISGFIPARKDMDKEPAIKSNPMVVGALKQLENSHPMPSIIEMNQVWVPMQKALELIWDGKDVKETLDQAVMDVKTGIASQNN